MKIDILAIGAHPDDVELSCAGTLAKEMANGKQVAILDLTQGELGTRGTAEIRAREAKAAARILGAKLDITSILPMVFLKMTRHINCNWLHIFVF